LLLAAVRRHLAMTTVADEFIGRVPVLYHLWPIIHLVLSFAGTRIIAEEDGLLGLANRGKSLAGRMRHIAGQTGAIAPVWISLSRLSLLTLAIIPSAVSSPFFIFRSVPASSALPSVKFMSSISIATLLLPEI
jgi:hypothetical protein